MKRRSDGRTVTTVDVAPGGPGGARATSTGSSASAAGPSDRPSVLVIQTAFLGDVILTTPLLSALAAVHGPVDVVTTPAAAGLIETHPAVTTVFRFDKRGADRGLRGLWRLSRRLRSRGYLRAYLPHGSWRSAALARLAGIGERVGFTDSPAAATYTRRVVRPTDGHEVERLLALAGGVGGTPPVRIALTGDDMAEADRWLRAHGVEPGFVAVAPGSIWGTKRWPGYAQLVGSLDRPAVIVGGRDDARVAQEILALAPGRAHSAAGELGLRVSAALLARAAVLVTNDSAPLHLATAVGTPIVALFGPTVPAFGFGPRGPRDRVIEHPSLACRPCSAHGPQVCPVGHHRCMRELSVQTVAAAVEAVLGAEAHRAIRTGH